MNTLNFLHTGLTGTEDVQYKVRAVSDRGVGAFSIRATFILAATPTTTTPTKVSANKNSITVQWALNSDGGSPVLGYLLYQLNVTTGGETLIYNGSSIPTITSFTAHGLYPGHFYQFRARALNRVGLGDYSAYSAKIMAAERPGKPATPRYKSSSATTITIEWEDNEDNGGSLVTAYKVSVDTGSLTSSTFDYVDSTS